MSETPYIQTLSDEQLDAMIERRRRIYLTYLRSNDAKNAEIAEYHLGRALTELMRRGRA